MRVIQVNQQVKAVTPNCETCGGPHSFNDCPAIVGNTQNVYVAGAYQGNSYQPQGNRNLLSYRLDNYLGPPGFNQNQNQNNQNQNFHNQNRNQGNHNPQGNNQGRSQFFQRANQNQNPPPAYQASAYQAPVYQAQFMKMNIASSSGSGTLPGNTITNPKEDLKAITTRSGTAYQGPTIPTTSSLYLVVERETEATKDTVHPTKNGNTEDVQPPVVQTESLILNYKSVVAPIIEPVASSVSARKPNQRLSIPYPSRLHDQKLCDKANDQQEKIFQIFKDLNFNISFADALILMPKFGPSIKSLLTNKDKLYELARTLLNEHYSEVLLKKFPEKPGDTGKFLISCDFPGMAECLALADLGASINLMPLSVWNKLSLPDVSPTCMTLELADRSISRPVGVAKDVFVKVRKFCFPSDFIIVDFDADPRVSIIPWISFLKIGRALIDVFEGELTLRVGKEAITFNLDKTSRYSANYNDMTANRIDVIDMACEEYSQEVLGFSDVIASGNPTPYYDPIVSTTSSTLTPFGNSDFLIEEVYAFLSLEDDPTSPEVDQSYLKPINLQLMNLLRLNSKTYISHLEYAFLEGDDKLPVIIAKDLSVEEKTALITVMKSHKRAIAWKLSDIKGIDPEFCTHKILMEEDFEPAVQHQRRVIPKIHDVIKNEVLKLLDAGLIYSISDSPWKTMEVLMDDFSVFENSFQTCLSHLERMLKRCEDTNLCLNWEKSHFMVKEGIVLGHKISKNEIEVDKAKVDVITKLPHPTTVKEKEMLAVVYAFEKFRSYLIMNKSIVYTDHSALKYLFAKKYSKARLLHWVLLLQEFTFKVIDTKGAENLAAGHLSRLENPHQNVLDPKEINESFPLETLNMVSSCGNSYTPWFADFPNYHAGNFVVKGMSSQQKNKFFKDVKHYFWDDLFCLKSVRINDRGTHFCNDQFAKVMLKFGVTHRLGTPYHPQTSSQVERPLLPKTQTQNYKPRENEEEEEDGGKENGVEDEGEDEEDNPLNLGKLKEKLKKFWLCDEKDVDLRIARLVHPMERRPELANRILTYTEAVRTIDPMKAVGKPHTLWVAFAKFYETYTDVATARVILDKAMQVNYKAMDNLASVWCELAEMELRHKNFKGALELMRLATAEPSAEVKRRVAADGNEPALWNQLVLSMSGSWIFDLRIAAPRIIINHAMLLEDHKYFEDAFKVYERGVKIFKYPLVKDIWVTYLSKFVKRYGKSKLERCRELFQHAVKMASAEVLKPLYLQYAKLEDDFGLAKEAMAVYDNATKAVPASEQLSMYEIYFARAAEIYGVPETREIYEQTISSEGLPEKDAMKMCIKYAEFEKSLGEIDRVRKIYVYASRLADPRFDSDFWKKWHEFEPDTRLLPEYMQKPTVVEAMDQLKRAGVPEDEMEALERQLAPKDDSAARKPGFVSSSIQLSETVSGLVHNQEEIELPEGSESDEEGKLEIAQNDVPDAVYTGLVGKRDEEEAEKEKETGDGDTRLVRVLTAITLENPSRRFYVCPNRNRPVGKHCGTWDWYDPELEHDWYRF
uniref:RNA-directed DNA polymerase n=1 Tax=Tanacetum cinerariifolium TaxID=118510 RepID=A0A6L2NYE1_TANCI|nr:pre-mRNA-splicing factor SYF1 [Tanacetum cinerariifolium]